MLGSIFSLAVLATSTLASVQIGERATSANPDNPAGTMLYVTEPACGSFRCIITWPVGSKVSVNWVNPPAGNVSISLTSNIGPESYPIVASYPAISQEGYCDSGAGLGVVQPGVECGQIQFEVPLGWKEAANYTIVVASLEDTNLVGYTDAITITAANSTTSGAPSGTVASLLTIPAPTSTNAGASTKFSLSLPAPTAVTGVKSSSSIAAAAATGSAAGTRSGTTTAGGASSTSGTAAGAAATSATPSSAGVKKLTPVVMAITLLVLTLVLV